MGPACVLFSMTQPHELLLFSTCLGQGTFRDQWLHTREESEVERESRGLWTGPVRRRQRDGGREPRQLRTPKSLTPKGKQPNPNSVASPSLTD